VRKEEIVAVKIELAPVEARVIGALIEKEITTPDQYPLSLNALTNACNQKSNRDPVMDLSEAVVQEAVDSLLKRYLVGKASGYGSRVVKYRHRFCNSEFGDLKLPPQEVAVLCELLLRGPQTPGELRTHGERLCPLGDVQRVEAALDALMSREEPFVVKLAREPGRRESRYAHLFCGDVPATSLVGSVAVAAGLAAPEGGELERLSRRVDALTDEVADLRRQLAQLLPGFDSGAGGP
jgi:uncharacterized protein YceH (UPF0502 family)